MSVLRRTGEFVRDQNHWIGLGGVIFGALLSAYFYFASKPTGHVALFFKTVKIAQAGMPIIKIYDDQNRPITSDVYGLEIVVWNNGNFPLGEKSDRVRRPLVIRLDPDANVLGSQIQATGATATEREMRVTPTIVPHGVELGWAEFDPGDAFKLLIIYTSKDQSNISFTSRFIDTTIQNLSVENEVNPAPDKFRFSLTWIGREYSRLQFNLENHLVSTLSAFFGFLLVIAPAFIMMASRNGERRARLRSIAIFLMIVGQFLFLGSQIFFSTSPPL